MADHDVKLHTSWASPFCCRVKWALDLKDIPYETIEEDLNNKTELLLQHNPVHKKVPVLVHDGKPICESMIIVEYLDEMWPHTHSLVPRDPLQRALARFWVKFAEENVSSIWMVFRTTGEEQEKAKKECSKMLQIMEEHAIAMEGEKYFGGEEVGIVDIAFGGIICLWFQVIEEIVGVKLFEACEFPRLHAWLRNFEELPAIKQNLPRHDALLGFLKGMRENLIRSS